MHGWKRGKNSKGVAGKNKRSTTTAPAAKKKSSAKGVKNAQAPAAKKKNNAKVVKNTKVAKKAIGSKRCITVNNYRLSKKQIVLAPDPEQENFFYKGSISEIDGDEVLVSWADQFTEDFELQRFNATSVFPFTKCASRGFKKVKGRSGAWNRAGKKQ